MSSDSHATVTYTLMSSYEVTINEYYGMPMDPLDPYVQLVMRAPPSPDYIPGPEAPPSPDYIPGLKYLEYLPPADDMLPAEEQPLPAAVSPTVESPGYITESEPEMEPEENDGDDEKSEGDSIDYLNSGGDDDANDDGDDLSEDDADDEDEEESSDSEEEEEEHLAPTVPAPALYSSVFESDETEPFEEGETAATPPPFGYRVAARIYVQPHILMPFRSDSEVERLLTIPTPPLSPVSLTSYTLPPLLCHYRYTLHYLLHHFHYLHRYHLLLVARIFLRQIRPTLTIAESRRADGKLIGRLRRERRYFRTVATTYAHVVAHSRDYCARIMDYCQSREKMAPKRARTTRANPDPTRTTTATEPMTQEAINNLIAQRDPGPLKFNGTEGVIGLTRWFERTESVFSISNCTSETQVKFASCTLIGSALTWWNSHMRAVGQEVAYAMPWKTLKKMMTVKYCPKSKVKKLEVDLWNQKVKGTDISSYTLRFQELSLLCGRMFPEESDKIERYVGGLPEMIRGNVMSYEPKSMQKAIESANEQMDQKLIGIADRQADNKIKFDNNSRNQQNQQPFRRNNNVSQAYAAGSGEKPYRGTKPLCPKCNFYHDGPCRPKCTNYKRAGHISRDSRNQAANPNYNNYNNNNRRATMAYQGVPKLTTN
nr:reverse transcriptase domain-containing protein [Tanacetum cinerariifolium]